MRAKLLALAVAAALVLMPAASAHADLPALPDAPKNSPRLHWEKQKVCVESHVSRVWDVATAASRWNSVAGGAPTFMLRGSCDGWKQRVTVRYDRPSEDRSGAAIQYARADGSMYHVRVVLNHRYIERKGFPRSTWSCVKSYTTTHELGHALGLRHYPNSHSGAVMSYQGWQHRCGGLAPSDREDLRKLYAS